ncbi:hypothetical protein N7532_002079 [Penicillium argentinense]|uniref:Uncharacterized protein n=1 Tax=Penicillium argentinense TaxID=1131581 RepID=A0A9W9G3T0_9EURO|nr:uncharacterized protein N7532_002079 [Penicillium argentinense]KAJ5111544.1 hypothetical protein N7532_002079 [Penicillium argentinense]
MDIVKSVGNLNWKAYFERESGGRKGRARAHCEKNQQVDPGSTEAMSPGQSSVKGEVAETLQVKFPVQVGVKTSVEVGSWGLEGENGGAGRSNV